MSALKMTLAAFLEWDAPGPCRWQLIAGVPEAMAFAAETHARLQAKLSSLIDMYLTAKYPSCAVLVNPGIVPSPNDRRDYLILDLAVTCSPPKPGRLYVEEPLVIVEILSPSNQKVTWLNVSSYKTIPSVMKIFVIDSSRVDAELWQCHENQSWLRKQNISGGDTIQLSSIGFSFELTKAYLGTGLV